MQMRRTLGLAVANEVRARRSRSLSMRGMVGERGWVAMSF
ncbi:MAG: hypothetical protein ACJA16_004433 [Akkermansiaceae bacterium]|jgi:hypothetical protein